MENSISKNSNIVKTGKYYYNMAKNLKTQEELLPSKFWESNIIPMLNRIGNDSIGLEELIHYAQRRGPFTASHITSEFGINKIIEKYESWLTSNGTPLDTFNPAVQESALTNSEFLINRNGRIVSNMFLWHLCASQRIIKHTKKPVNTILEIGGGYGGLARLMKLLLPSVRYFILDLPESLFFSYIFLSANFPDSRIKFITDKNEMPNPGNYNNFDFILVPTALIDTLSGISADIVINTASLGEMRQTTIDRYMKFIQQDIRVKYFYSINHYGNFYGRYSRWVSIMKTAVNYPIKLLKRGDLLNPSNLVNNILKIYDNYKKAGLRCFIPHAIRPNFEPNYEDTCNCAVTLDSYWKIILWKFLDKDSFSQIEEYHAPYLELLAERLPKNNITDDYLIFESKKYFNEARHRIFKDKKWHSLMWKSVNLRPAEESLAVFLKFLAANKYVEYSYYKNIYDKLKNKK